MTDEEKQAIEILKTIKRPILATGFERQTNIIEALKMALNLIEKQQTEIEKKDKIIDEMAKFMEIEGTGRRSFSCIFRENEECNENGCKVCIKKYFKKKVEDK